MIRTSARFLAPFAHLALALLIALNSLLALPALAWAQGETPRCPDAPFRVPSGNFVWAAYFKDWFGANHVGIDYVDITKAYTPTTGYFPEDTRPRPPLGDVPALPSMAPDWDFPENVTPVYSPITGYMERADNVYPASYAPNGFQGSVLITGTLDNVWASNVPTRTLRLWLAHMGNQDGSVKYVVRESGPINEGDLIGYQGKAITNKTHLHIGIYDSTQPSPTGLDGVISPTTYFNAYVDGAEVIGGGLDTFGDNDAQAYPYLCRQTPVGVIETPAWNANVGVPFATISGYALDRTNITQTIGIGGGIDLVKLFLDGYDPASVPAPTANGTLLGTVPVNLPRTDIAAIYGAQVTNSGWSYNWDLTAVPLGRHAIYLYAHQTSPAGWHLMDVRYVNVSILTFLPLLVK